MEVKKKTCTKCKKLSIIWKTRTVGGEKPSLCQQCNSKIERELKKEKVVKVREKKKAVKNKKLFSNTELLKVADRVFSLYIRLRDTNDDGFGICCSSGRYTDWSQIQNGHYISRKYMKYRFSEINCNGQSAMDNVRLSGNIVEYRRFMIEKYGVEAELALFLGSKEEFHYNSEFLLDVIKIYAPQVKKMLSMKTFDTSNYEKEILKIESIYNHE